MIVELPWPNPVLNPNRLRQVHWSKRHRASQTDRKNAGALVFAKLYKRKPRPVFQAPLKVTITFHPPDKRRRDRDNLVGQFKAMADGVADAIKVDDADWIPTYDKGDVIKGGMVVIDIEESK